MIRLKESIHVPADSETAFRYVSDFSHIREWDPGVVASSRTTGPHTGVGATWDLTLKFGPFRPKMRYTVTAYQPGKRVALEGAGPSFSATDTIVFQKTAQGTRIDYQADIRFSGPGRSREKLLSPLLILSGKKAMQGLARALGRGKPEPSTRLKIKSGSSPADYLADHALVPGIMMFSRYGYELGKRLWTEPDRTLYGKNVVITGATSGIGKAGAFELARKKARLTLVARNKAKAGQVRQEIMNQTGNPHVDVVIADLSLMTDIRQTLVRLGAASKPVDILINNAGALFNNRQETAEGIEQTFATNLLGVFYLTMGLKKALARAGNARIITVSSGGMYTQKIHVHDLENRKAPYHGAKAYARAKRGVVVLTKIWSERFKPDGIRVHAMHPGWVDTPGLKTSLPRFYQRVSPLLRSPEQGADTLVWLALSGRAGQSTGRFWLDRRPRETVVIPGTRESRRERQQLWDRLNGLVPAVQG